MNLLECPPIFQANTWKTQGDEDQKEITSCSALHEVVFKLSFMDFFLWLSDKSVIQAFVEAQVPNDLFSFEARNLGWECR